MSNHAITNNLNKENQICIKLLLILKEVNIIVLHSIVKVVEKLLEESFSFIDWKKLRFQSQKLKAESHLEDVWESVE